MELEAEGEPSPNRAGGAAVGEWGASRNLGVVGRGAGEQPRGKRVDRVKSGRSDTDQRLG